MHLSGANFTLQAKNGRHSTTPGLHLSAAPGSGAEEAAGRLTSACRALRDPLLGSPAPRPEGTAADVGPLPSRLAPLKLAPLRRPEEKKSPTGPRQEDTRPSGRVRKKAPGGPAPACASPPAGPAKDPPGARPLRGAGPAERTADRRPLGDVVVCRGAPAPTACTKPSPPPPSAKSPIPAAADPGQNAPGVAAPLQTGGRRRLRRIPHLEDGGSRDVTAAGELQPQAPPAGPKSPRGKCQRAERALREAGRVLENAAKRDAQQQNRQQPAAAGGLEVSGRAIRRTAVADLQELVL